MTPEERERLSILVERRLAGLLDAAGTEELSSLLEASPEARELYLRAVEVDLDLRTAGVEWAGHHSIDLVTAQVRPRYRLLEFSLVGAAAAILVAVTLYAVVMRGSSGRGTRDYSQAPITDIPRSTASDRPRNPPPPPPPLPPPVPPGVPPRVDAGALRQSVRQTTWMINLAGVISETLRLRGLVEDRDRMTARAAECDAKLRAIVAKIEETGERVQVEDYIRPGDTIVGFAQKDFGTLNSAGAADLMANWLNTFRANSMEQVILLRGTQRVVVYIDIPEASKELLELARTPTGDMSKGLPVAAASPGPPGTSAPSANPGVIPDNLVKAIESGFSNLPAGYRQILPPIDRNRMEFLLQKKVGTEDDLNFLRDRILTQAIPACEREAALVKTKIAELESKVKATTAVDVIHFKDGRKVEGQILEDTEAAVKIKGRLGTMTIPRGDVLRVEKGKGAGLEFPDRLKAAEGKLEDLVSLLAWCKEKNLKLEGEYVAYRILALDPANEAARSLTALKRPF